MAMRRGTIKFFSDTTVIDLHPDYISARCVGKQHHLH